MALLLKPPPKNYDISHNFQNVDRRNIGGNGVYNAGVFIVRSKNTGKTFVEKKYSTENITDGTAEFEILPRDDADPPSVPHRNIVQFITGFVDWHAPRGPTASIYLEYCDKGNLLDFMKIQRRRGFPFDEELVWDLFMQLVNAVAFMQYGVDDACRNSGVPRGWVGVVHRDIKLDNIFLCSIAGPNRFRLVLGDFGQAIREDDDGNWGRQYLNGNLATAPPEVMAGDIGAYSYSGDLWAVGWCISAICKLTDDSNYIGDAGEGYSESLNQAIERLMNVDPNRRPEMWKFARNMPRWRREGMMEGTGMARRGTW